ncbi:MAG TPA: LLM class flavin-dependent oxidoreductase [Xanthobacteraceae bacterium]|nr:LLM class flavin-dependent oxidoreductase [Xanthobacteraceae bacterium]
MDFGVFDHLDRYDGPLDAYYEARLKLIELYDAAGFYSYHLAEHHATPLGMAPSPSVFLAAVAQRSKRLRFGPMVYALPLYHPLRLIEEICMLDQMSGGRLDIGFGRGASPIELSYFGQDPKQAPAIYAEGVELIMKGLTERSLTFAGKHFRFDNVPLEVWPLQKPHPPVWYGVHAPDAAERAARRGLHTINLDPTDETRACSERYRAVWRELHGEAPLPKLGLGRFIVVADTDREALALARRAYPKWHEAFTFLPRRHGVAQQHPRPAEFDALAARGQGFAGSPASVTAWLADQLAATGTNYVVGQFAFGDLAPDEFRHSVELFARHVMPELRPSRDAQAVQVRA